MNGLTLQLAVPALVFVIVLALVLALTTAESAPRQQMHDRLRRQSLTVASDRAARVDRSAVLSGGRIGGSPALARLSGTAWAAKVRDQMMRAGVDMRLSRYYLIRIGLAAVAFLAGFLAMGSPLVGAVAAVVAFFVPRVVVAQMAKRRAAKFEAQLAPMIGLVVGSLRVGQGLLQALESTIAEQDEPMKGELQRIVDQVNVGVTISDAMEELRTRFDSRDVDLLAAAISINRQTGGNLTEVLENLAGTVRQRQDIRAEAKSLTAAPRATGYIVSILPIALAVYQMVVSEGYRDQVMNTTAGKAIVIGGIGWALIGLLISQQIAKVEY